MREIILASMGEMVLKGQNRKSFENTLLKTLRNKTTGQGRWKVHAAQSTIYLQPQDQEADGALEGVFAACKKVFGIVALSRAAVCEKDFKDICKTAGEYLSQELKDAVTFKVQAKRADKSFAMNSMQISAELGGYLLHKNPHLQVDVKKPQRTVMVEVREDAAYVHGGKHKGAGGLPVPSSGRSALLLSGGIDSPVAAWMMAKRGLALVAIHFASPPYTSPRAAAKVQSLADILCGWCGPMPYYHVPYTQAQEYIHNELARQEYFTVIMRRSMLRIANIIAEKEHCASIVTGESLAQVASQTLQALACTDAAQPLPVLRPCIGMDKTEITDLARMIGTFETSILPYEDCCTIFNPPHPKTKPRLEDVLRLEEALMPTLAQLEQQAADEAEFTLRLP